ncbi:transmembrane protein 176 [Plectropomus leopardus]|uniref:transmembrane protein 176 n=1 Tax=Plectropomus leopardus TaxID=160734 RepID=UPI001C4C8128|nr:transmembrane protein 176 [Plectropomus leopardus]XP_042340283.1 transmembrane protein 176 [Plectropomus leopardus]
MAVAVSRDLTVHVLQDTNAAKLADRQQALRAAILRGEPKSLGVSQLMLGLMVMSYSIPLCFAEHTEVVRSGVPWWSGIMFVAAGAVAITLDKHCTMKILWACFTMSLVSTVLSVVALIIYSVDIGNNPEVPCIKTDDDCSEAYYSARLSRGLKSSLLVFTLADTAISAILCFLLFRQRHNFGQYDTLLVSAPSSPTSVRPPDLN